MSKRLREVDQKEESPVAKPLLAGGGAGYGSCDDEAVKYPDIRVKIDPKSVGTKKTEEESPPQHKAVAKARRMHTVTKGIHAQYGLTCGTVVGLFVVYIVAMAVVPFLSLAVLALHFFGSLSGAYGVYQWGSVDEELELLKMETQKFQEEIDLLHESCGRLKNEVSSLQKSTDGLQKSCKDLEKNLDSFQELNDELMQIQGANESLAATLDSTLRIFSDTKKLMHQNEKAALLKMYYEVQLHDSEEGMSKKEYARFLGRLPHKHQKTFGELSFEEIAGTDEVIDLAEFQILIQRSLEKLQYELNADLL